MCFGENLGEKGEKTAPEKCSKLAKIRFIFYFLLLFKSEVWDFYFFFFCDFLTSGVHLVYAVRTCCHLLTSAILASSTFWF